MGGTLLPSPHLFNRDGEAFQSPFSQPLGEDAAAAKDRRQAFQEGRAGQPRLIHAFEVQDLPLTAVAPDDSKWGCFAWAGFFVGWLCCCTAGHILSAGFGLLVGGATWLISPVIFYMKTEATRRLYPCEGVAA